MNRVEIGKSSVSPIQCGQGQVAVGVKGSAKFEAFYKCGQVIGVWRVVKVWEEGTGFWYSLRACIAQVDTHTLLEGVPESEVASFYGMEDVSEDDTDPRT